MIMPEGRGVQTFGTPQGSVQCESGEERAVRRMRIPDMPIGHANDAREMAERRLASSTQLRVIHELAQARRWRRMQRVAARLHLRRLSERAARRAQEHALRTKPGLPTPISAEQHVNWLW